MSELTNYIKERIETLREEQEHFSMHGGNFWRIDSAIYELQAVLSKIEETKGKTKKFFELDISLENPRIPEEQMEAFRIAADMSRIFLTYNIDHTKLCLFPEGVTDGEIVTGRIAGIQVAYPKEELNK